MKILQICNYAAKYRGNFIESLEYFRKNSLGDGDFMLYAFPERMTERRNQWYVDLKKEVPAAIYKSSVKEKIRAFRKIIKEKRRRHHSHTLHRHEDRYVRQYRLPRASREKFKHYRSSFGSFGTIKKFFRAALLPQLERRHLRKPAQSCGRPRAI